MPTDLSLGEILHLSLGESVKCFGLTKIPGGTRPCNHPLGREKLAKARIILVQTPGQLERGGQTIDQTLIDLSHLLVQSSRHGVAGDTRRENLISEWQGFLQDFRRAQIHSDTPIEILHQTDDDELDDVSEDEDLQEVPAPVLAIESDTTTSIVATRSTHIDLDTTPTEESQVQISQEHSSNVLRPVPESLGDRTSLNPACLSVAHTSFPSPNDISPEYVWYLLLQFCFGFRALMLMKFNAFCSIDGSGDRFVKGLFADWGFSLVIKTNFFSNKLTRALVFMIPFCYGLFSLLQILLRNYVLMVPWFI